MRRASWVAGFAVGCVLAYGIVILALASSRSGAGHRSRYEQFNPRGGGLPRNMQVTYRITDQLKR